MSKMFHYIFFLSLNPLVLSTNDCQKFISCNMNLEMAKKRVQYRQEYDVKLAVKCCEEWLWTECIKTAIKEKGDQCNMVNTTHDLQKTLDERITNLINSSDCSEFKADTFRCYWPPWMHFVVLLIGLILIITMVSLFVLAVQPKNHKNRNIGELVQITADDTKNTTYITSKTP